MIHVPRATVPPLYHMITIKAVAAATAHDLLDATANAFRICGKRGSSAEEDQNSRKDAENEQWQLDTAMWTVALR